MSLIRNIQEFIRNEELKTGDPLWYIERLVTNATGTTYGFLITVFTMVFCTTEVLAQMYLLSDKPSLDAVLNYAPMFFSSLHVILIIIPFLVQRNEFGRLIFNIRTKFWPLKSKNKKASRETMRDASLLAKVSIFYLTMIMIGATDMMPWSGIDYSNTIFPPVAALGKIQDAPNIMKLLILSTNFVMIWFKGSFMALYALHVAYLLVLYECQYTLIKCDILSIANTIRREKNDWELPDDQNYQITIEYRLKKCVKHHIYLEKVAKQIQDYFSLPLFLHTFSSILIITSLAYISLLGSAENKSNNAITIEFLMAVVTAFVYTHYAQIFSNQKERIYEAIFATPWNTFNIRNQKFLITFALSVQNANILSAGGMINVNYSLYIWIMHKVVNAMSILLVMAEET